MSERNRRQDAWDDADEADKVPFRTLTREQAQALRAQHPPVSPWRVIAAQAVIGALVALLAWAASGRTEVMWSALYGAGAVVVPGAMMARGMTSRLSSLSPGASAVSFMVWEFGKIAAAVALLVMAPRLVPSLSWPALLVSMVVCMKVYWVALLWRR